MTKNTGVNIYKLVMRKLLPIFIAPLIILLLISSLYTPNKNVAFAETAEHLVISEIQIGGDVTGDEFIEIYNPTDSTVTLDGYRLTRKASGAGAESNLVASMSGTISPHGYFLVASNEYDGTISPDNLYSNTGNRLGAGNVVVLYSDAGLTEVDKVGFGEAVDSEDSPTENPAPNGSIERKATSSASTESMGTGGSDETNGNGEDNDNNSSDFVLQPLSNPQNSQSAVEMVESSPTESPTETPSPTDDPSITPSPTDEPTDTPTTTPTDEPTQTPTPTDEPTPSESPTPTPTAKPTSRMLLGFFPLSRTICYVDYSRGFFFFFPKISCVRI